MTKKQMQERAEAIERLRTMLKPGDTVYVILRSVSRSGMSRQIGVAIQTQGGGLIHPNYLVGTVLGCRVNKAGNGLVIGGCGMDMGMWLVYELGRALFPEGFVPANAGMHGRNRTPDTELDTDGGYALRKEWV